MVYTLGSMIAVFMIIVSVGAAATAFAVLTYVRLRRSLYQRPLTDEERWAETTQQSPESLVELNVNTYEDTDESL